LVTFLHDFLLYCFCLLTESYETNQSKQSIEIITQYGEGLIGKIRVGNLKRTNTETMR